MQIPAHLQRETLHLVEYFPAHEPREGDPHYAHFDAARRRLKAAGRLVCWLCGKDEAAAGAPIELHHDKVEFALANGVDLERFIAAFPEFGLVHGDEEAFLAWVEGEGNLLALCKEHHTGLRGIHVIPMPAWGIQRYWRADLPAPGEVAR